MTMVVGMPPPMALSRTYVCQGMDYPVSLLAELRISCGTAGQRVRTSTESGRDAMFRAAVATALDMAQDGTSGLIAGCTPAQFICGLAADLGACQLCCDAWC